MNFLDCTFGGAHDPPHESRTLSSFQICASGIFESICKGDSGGPSVMRIDDKLILVGVNSAVFNIKSSTIFGPSVLVRVSAHLPWIRAVTGLPAPGPGLHN